MLNKHSDYLVILVATYNRLESLKAVIKSIEEQTNCPHEVIVIDGGSNDGTIDYIKVHPNVTPVFQGKLLGTARSYNQVWREINCKYTCWLSDDTEVVNGSLDLAVDILDHHPKIGMVGLKMKDTMGPWKRRCYMGFISQFGILNCNHGILPYALLQSLNYFNQDYISYMIDPDLTASVLCAGYKVVMTKRIGVLHHREWILHEGDERINYHKARNSPIYSKKFNFLNTINNPMVGISRTIRKFLLNLLYFISTSASKRLGLDRCDRDNLINGRFIRFIDPLENFKRPYYLVQQIPDSQLRSKDNPFNLLLKNTDR